MSKLPFTFDAKSVEGYVVVPCPDREYGIQRILVPKDFWPEGKFLLSRIWNKENPAIHTDGSFQEVGELVVFNFSPLTVNTSKFASLIRTFTAPIYSASRSIKCVVDWPEMAEWRRKHQQSGSMTSDSPLESTSPVSYLLDATRRGEIKAVPFGDGAMVKGTSAEIDYLAHSS